jgi:Fe-S-cluster containining protein
MPVRVFNLTEARFECTFGRGCAGICCRNGRPPVYDDEAARIAGRMDALLPLMRTSAARVAVQAGFMSRRRKAGTHTLRVVDGWCVFFNTGCVLHQLGAAEAQTYRYKPFACATFPLEQHHTRGWYVRQKGLLGEVWDLPCLDPSTGQPAAASTLGEELRLIDDGGSPGADRRAAADRPRQSGD